MSTAIIAMGRSLEGFDMRMHTDFAMSTLNSRQSPGRTKFSHVNSFLAPSAYDRTTKVDGGDSSSDQMPFDFNQLTFSDLKPQSTTVAGLENIVG